MKKILFLFFAFLLLLAYGLIKAQRLPSGQNPGQNPLPYGYPNYGYPDQYPYDPNLREIGPQVFDYTTEQMILQRREYFMSLLGANTISLPPEDSYFFLVGQFSLLLPYLLFSLPQPQVSVFTLASVFLMYP
jgi:hypothetical protein